MMVFALFQFYGAWAEDATFEHGTSSTTRWGTTTDETSGIKVTFNAIAKDNKFHKVDKDEVFSIESTKDGVNITAVKITIGGTDYTFTKANETYSTLTTTEFGATKVSIKATDETKVGTITVTYTTNGVVTPTTFSFSATPVDKATNVAINTPIVLTAGGEGTLVLADDKTGIQVKAGETAVPGTATIAKNVLTFTPTNYLAFDTEYTVTVPAGAYKIGDKDCEEYNGTFTTMENASLVNPDDGTLPGGSTFELGNITLIYGGDGDRVSNAVWSYLQKEEKSSYGSGIVHKPIGTKWDGKHIRKCDNFDAVNEYCVYNKDTQKAEYGDYNDTRKWGWATRPGEFDHTLHLQIDKDEVWQKTFHQPCYGNIMFEPKADGVLTVYVEQQGALNYKDGTFLTDVLRKRPIYIVGESGLLIKDVKATTISYIGTDKGNTGDNNNFEQLIADNALEGDDMYTKEQAQTLRAMYDQWLKDNNYDDNKLQGVICLHHHSTGDNNTETVTDAKGKEWKYTPKFKKLLYKVNGCDANGDGEISKEENDKYNDGSGFMLIDEGYVAYTFNVKAGKTYNMFGYRTKIGYVGFKFEQDANYSPKEITLNDDADNTEAIKNAAKDGGTYPDNQAYNVTLKREFIPNQWQTLVLPFSVGQTELKEIFGEGTQIVHFTRYNKDNNTLYLRRHVMQMIVGGTPVLIKPTKVDNLSYVVFNNVHFVGEHIDHMSPQKDGPNPCTIMGTYKAGVTVPAYSFFISGNDGNVFQTTKDRTDILAFRAWIQGLNESASSGKTAQFLDFGDIPEDEVTGITNALIGETKPVTGNIYNMNGQLVRKNATSVEGLPKGIYIMNGSKVIVK